MPKTMARETAIKYAAVPRRKTVISTHATRVMEIADHAQMKADMSVITQLIVMETGIADHSISDSIARVRLSTRHKIAMKAAAPSHLSLVMDQSAGLKALITAWTDRAALS